MDGGNARNQRSILITGAESGIGRATAQLFARQGWLVGCLDVNAPALDSLRNELGTGSGLYRAVAVTDRAALLAVIDEFATASGGQLDLLFSNACIEAKGRFEAMPWDKVVAIANVNLLAAMSLVQATLPLLKAATGSLCLSTSSASAIFRTAGLAVYSATKHAVSGLIEALAVEFKAHGVRAADVLPGIIDTGMLSEVKKARLPKEGMLRMLPAQAIADTVWEAYVGDRLHWYVPPELSDYDVEVKRRPEAARDRRIAGGF